MAQRKLNFDDYNEKEDEFLKLMEQSKKLSDLVFWEPFEVKEIMNQNYRTEFSPGPTVVGGPGNPIYEGGYKSILTLSVEPGNEGVPIKELTFEGSRPPIVSGDYINALIPAYNHKEIEAPEGIPDAHFQKRSFYLPREYQERESAIEIATMSDDGQKIKSRDRSVHYDFFLPKNTK